MTQTSTLTLSDSIQRGSWETIRSSTLEISRLDLAEGKSALCQSAAFSADFFLAGVSIESVPWYARFLADNTVTS